MIPRPLFTAAALGLGLLAAAPAMAGSTFSSHVIGDDNDVDGCTRQGGQWGVYVDGDGNTVDGCVAGPGTRVVTASIGRRTTTHMRVVGYDNQVGAVARSGGSITAHVRGDRNQVNLYASLGTHIEIKMNCDQCYVNGSVR